MSSKIINNKIILVVMVLCTIAIIAKDKISERIFKEESTSSVGSSFDASIEKYIMSHPEVLIKSVEEMQMKKMAEMAKQQEEALKTSLPQIMDLKNTPIYGDKNAKVKIAMFFDYTCGYCKRAAPHLKKLIEEDKDLVLLFKDLPILGEAAKKDADLGLAIYKTQPELYADYYFKLMAGEKAENIIKGLSLDIKDLEAKSKTTAIGDILSENMKIAETIGVRGTPTFVIGDRIVTFASPEEFKKEINEIKKAMK